MSKIRETIEFEEKIWGKNEEQQIVMINFRVKPLSFI